MSLSADDYREGALARLSDAQNLYDNDYWAGAVYLAGRAAEAMLRALIVSRSRVVEEGHNLRSHLKRVRHMGLLTSDQDDRVEAAVNELAILWRNDLRFTGRQRFARLLRDAKRLRHTGYPEYRKIVGDPQKANALSVLNAAEAVVTRGEKAWIHSKTS